MERTVQVLAAHCCVLKPYWIARSSAAVEVINWRSNTPLASKQLQIRNGMTGTVQTQEGGVQGGRGPPWIVKLICRSSLQKPGCHLVRLNRSSGVQRECSPPWITLTTLGTTSMQVAAQAPPHFLWSAGSHPTCYACCSAIGWCVYKVLWPTLVNKQTLSGWAEGGLKALSILLACTRESRDKPVWCAFPKTEYNKRKEKECR